jgi:hypothetical protein
LLPVRDDLDLRGFPAYFIVRRRQNRQTGTIFVREMMDISGRLDVTRFAAALILTLTVNPVALYAQDHKFTITAPTAEVYRGPSNATPVIGHVARGRVMTVSRNLGSWVKVAWPAGPDGAGYVHVTMGHFGSPTSAEAPAAATRPSPAAARATTASPRPAGSLTRTPPLEAPVAPPAAHTSTVGHMLGVGGMVGSMSTFGATARVWRHSRLGIHVGYTRDAITSDASTDRVISTQFEPGAMYALFDRVSDYVWLRPYVGGVVGFRHQTLRTAAPESVEIASDNGVGFRVVGGCEVTFAALPRLGVSAEVGYRHYPTPFAGFEAKTVGVAVAGHWYIK